MNQPLVQNSTESFGELATSFAQPMLMRQIPCRVARHGNRGHGIVNQSESSRLVFGVVAWHSTVLPIGNVTFADYWRQLDVAAELPISVGNVPVAFIEVGINNQQHEVWWTAGEAHRPYQSEGYRRYLALAGRFLDEPEGSDSQILAASELSERIALEQGRKYQARGGDARAVLARIRQRQNQSLSQ